MLKRTLIATLLALLTICGGTTQLFSDQVEANTEKVVTENVYVTRTGKKYHRRSCHYLKSVIPIDRKDAVLGGYAPCKVCQPG